MHLIIGGAYQGKLDYARRRFDLGDEEIFTCTEDKPADLSKLCIYHVEEYAMWCLRNGKEPAQDLEEHKALWNESIIICNDVSCGVVPVDAEVRAWREAVGRMLSYLAERADSVTRLFCSLPQVLK